MADYTKEPAQINIDIGNRSYGEDEEDIADIKKVTSEPSEQTEDFNKETLENYNEVITMLGDFEDE